MDLKEFDHDNVDNVNIATVDVMETNEGWN